MDSMGMFLFMISSYVYLNIILMFALHFFTLAIESDKLQKQGKRIKILDYFKIKSIEELGNFFIYVTVFVLGGIIIITVLAAQYLSDHMEDSYDLR